MLLNRPQPALDQDAVALFRSELPSGVIPAGKAALAENIAGGSPFLRQLMLRDPVFAGRLLSADPGELLALQLAGLGTIDPALSQSELMARLRQLKKRVALLVAVADLSGRWDVEQVTGALTAFADGALQAAVSWLLTDFARAGKIDLEDPSRPLEGCGYVVLAMGKQGAHELNFSSDIDLIILYDAMTPLLADPGESSTFFVRFTRRLVQVMQDVTEDGYVFRTDLRLRPDRSSAGNDRPRSIRQPPAG